MKGTSEARLTGPVAVQIAWITAILVCAVAILIGLVSGTGSGNSSQQFPGFAFSGAPSDGRDSSQQSPNSASFDPAATTVGAAAHHDRKGRAMKGAAGDRSGAPTGSGSQPEDTGGRTPVVKPRPKPPQTPEGGPPEAPQAPSGAPPKPAQAPPVTPPDSSPEPPVTPPDSSPAPPEPSPAPPVIPAP